LFADSFRYVFLKLISVNSHNYYIALLIFTSNISHSPLTGAKFIINISQSLHYDAFSYSIFAKPIFNSIIALVFNSFEPFTHFERLSFALNQRYIRIIYH